MDLILTAKFGDACLHKQTGYKNYRVSYSGTELDWIMYKAKQLGYSKRVRSRTQSAGAWGKKLIHGFTTAPSEYITSMARLSLEEAIGLLTIEELIVWYLDDGSWHKNKQFMHLYCNTFNDSQLELLTAKLTLLLGISPRPRKDRKKDGRSYNYLYFSTDLSRVFGSFVESFVTANQIKSMYYKVGLWGDGSTTISQESSGQETAKQAAAQAEDIV